MKKSLDELTEKLDDKLEYLLNFKITNEPTWSAEHLAAHAEVFASLYGAKTSINTKDKFRAMLAIKDLWNNYSSKYPVGDSEGTENNFFEYLKNQLPTLKAEEINFNLVSIFLENALVVIQKIVKNYILLMQEISVAIDKILSSETYQNTVSEVGCMFVQVKEEVNNASIKALHARLHSNIITAQKQITSGDVVRKMTYEQNLKKNIDELAEVAIKTMMMPDFGGSKSKNYLQPEGLFYRFSSVVLPLSDDVSLKATLPYTVRKHRWIALAFIETIDSQDALAAFIKLLKFVDTDENLIEMITTYYKSDFSGESIGTGKHSMSVDDFLDLMLQVIRKIPDKVLYKLSAAKKNGSGGNRSMPANIATLFVEVMMLVEQVSNGEQPTKKLEDIDILKKISDQIKSNDKHFNIRATNKLLKLEAEATAFISSIESYLELTNSLRQYKIKVVSEFPSAADIDIDFIYLHFNTANVDYLVYSPITNRPESGRISDRDIDLPNLKKLKEKLESTTNDHLDLLPNIVFHFLLADRKIINNPYDNLTGNIDYLMHAEMLLMLLKTVTDSYYSFSEVNLEVDQVLVKKLDDNINLLSNVLSLNINDLLPDNLANMLAQKTSLRTSLNLPPPNVGALASPRRDHTPRQELTPRQVVEAASNIATELFKSFTS